MNKVIEEVDGDNDGYISYEEFLRVATNRKKLLQENKEKSLMRLVTLTEKNTSQ